MLVRPGSQADFFFHRVGLPARLPGKAARNEAPAPLPRPPGAARDRSRPGRRSSLESGVPVTRGYNHEASRRITAAGRTPISRAVPAFQPFRDPDRDPPGPGRRFRLPIELGNRTPSRLVRRPERLVAQDMPLAGPVADGGRSIYPAPGSTPGSACLIHHPANGSRVRDPCQLREGRIER